MKVAISPYAASDLGGVRSLILGIQRGEFGFAITWEDQPDLHDIAGWYRAGKGEFWVARDEAGQAVGTIGLRDIGGGAGALRKMFVAQEWRGAKRAVALSLVETLLGHARAHGFATILLGTTEAFRAAHRFYEKRGFRRVEGAALPPAFPRMSGDTRFYRLDLR
ncbi:MAG: GNAT family N-acetyltransferase [Candidatus Odyssella sp.]|nr:GNAT family N-acetyltransferase [Candidatus Odyssella sp.]